MKIKFNGSDDPDFEYVASSHDKELMDDLYDFLMFDNKRHKDDVPKPKYYTSPNGVYSIFLAREHIERILITYSHH